MKPFKTGLVAGKFAPLHFGHEELIEKARTYCDRLILLSWSRPEMPLCPPKTRERWLKARFPDLESWVLTPRRITALQKKGLSIPNMPNNSAPDDDHRRFVAAFCLSVLGSPVDAVFTGEDYGLGFAKTLQDEFSAFRGQHTPVEHIPITRRNPVSGTLLRDDIHANRHLLAPEVYRDFIERICFLGGESTGKSTLSSALADRYRTYCAEEYGREFWEKKDGDLSYPDFLTIAHEQVSCEERLSFVCNRYLFCDTSPLTTLFYCEDAFGSSVNKLKLLAKRRYDRVFLCAPDFAFVQDGTRTGDEFRQQQHRWYVEKLSEMGVPYVLLSGSLETRLTTVETILSEEASLPPHG